MESGQRRLTEAWYRGARWLWVLRPLECLFRGVTALRRQLYRTGVLASYRAEKPVVIVGNITVGGSGKTPVVIALVEALDALGIRAGVVSRGYGASAGQFPHVVTDLSTSADCGDEPLLIYRRTACPCVVAPSRTAAVRVLLGQFAVDVVISDDGMQHYALDRDLEIAVLDADARCGNGFCLPAGPLREPVSRLDSVDFVLYRGGEGMADSVHYEQLSLVHVRTGEQRPLQADSLSPRVYALAGIGQPGQFFESLTALGFSLERRIFPDHHAYVARDFTGLDDRPIIMTEKDAVKCGEFAGDNAWFVKIRAQLPDAVPRAVAALVHS